MSDIGGIIKKELRELLTLQSIIPIMVMALVFGSLGTSFSGMDQASQPPIVGLVDLDGGEYADIVTSTVLNNSDVIYQGISIEEGKQAVRDNNAGALLVIVDGFSSDITDNRSGQMEIYWYMKGTGIMETISLANVNVLMAEINTNLSRAIIADGSGLDANITLSPMVASDNTMVKDKEMDGVNPMVVSAVIDQQNIMMPILIMLVIVLIGGIVISSMGMEKENKTLETLLTLPISRTSIVAGKLIGAAVVGLIFGGIYMIGLGVYLQSFSASTSIDLSQYGLTLDALDYVVIGVMMFLTILSALAICMILGAFAKNYKSAQSLTLPVTLLAMIPMFVIMLSDFSNLSIEFQVLLFAIPFTHPMMAIENLMFDNWTLVIGGLAYNLAFSLATIYVAVRIFKSDVLLTGLGWTREKLRKRMRR